MWSGCSTKYVGCVPFCGGGDGAGEVDCRAAYAPTPPNAAATSIPCTNDGMCMSNLSIRARRRTACRPRTCSARARDDPPRPRALHVLGRHAVRLLALIERLLMHIPSFVQGMLVAAAFGGVGAYAARQSTSPAPSPPPQKAVSYTHLTLP